MLTASLWVQLRTNCPLISIRISPSLSSAHLPASRICLTFCPYGLSAIVNPKPMWPFTTRTVMNSGAPLGRVTAVDVLGKVDVKCWYCCGPTGDSLRAVERIIKHNQVRLRRIYCTWILLWSNRAAVLNHKAFLTLYFVWYMHTAVTAPKITVNQILAVIFSKKYYFNNQNMKLLTENRIWFSKLDITGQNKFYQHLQNFTLTYIKCTSHFKVTV